LHFHHFIDLDHIGSQAAACNRKSRHQISSLRTVFNFHFYVTKGINLNTPTDKESLSNSLYPEAINAINKAITEANGYLPKNNLPTNAYPCKTIEQRVELDHLKSNLGIPLEKSK